MAETITIPSPSVFLRASPDPTRLDAAKQDDPNNERLKAAATKKKNNNSSNNKKKTSAATTKPRREGAAVVKPKQSKSRNGCVTCKAKRLKCDEAKPSCQQCKKRNVDCGGYKKDFKWRPFEETNVASNIAKQNKGVFPVLATGNGLEKRTSASPAGASSSEEPPVRSSPSFSQQDFVSPEAGLVKHPGGQENPHFTVRPTSVGDSPTLSDSGAAAVVDLSIQDAEPSPQSLQRHDTTQESMFQDMDMTTSAMFNFDMDFDEFLQSTEGVMAEMDADFDKGLQEIAKMPEVTPDYDAWAMRLASRPSFESPNTPSSMASMMFPERITYLYEQPSLSQTSPEMMMLRYDRLTCGILSIKDGPNENPWRTLIWPMAQTSPALYHAVSSMTAFHSSRDIPALKVAGHEHKSESVRNLLEGVEEGTMNLDTAIATTLALAFAETWDQHISSGNDHIQGARAMINIALSQHKRSPLTGINLARLKFLCNAWVYLDVICRITAVDDDMSDDYDNVHCLYSETYSPEPGASGHPGFGINFGMPIDATLDPLMGCANTLFPLIGRTANLVRRVVRAESNSPPIISQAMELKLLIETWDAPAYIEPPEDPTTDVSHSLQTAEAYRWATLLYLHQAVPEIPSLSSAELAKKVLVFLATVPLASRCVIIHIYPLMMAGCEAVADEDRQWVRDRWNAMSQRMRIGIIDKCVEVMEEVWRRRDEHKRLPQQRSLVSSTNALSSRHDRPLTSRRGSSFNNIANASEGAMVWAEKLRRMTIMGDIDSMDKAAVSCRGSRDAVNGASDKLYTVRGRLHWVGVMQDWGWEVLLG